MRPDARSQSPHSFHNTPEVHLHAVRHDDAELTRVAYVRGGAGGADERFGWDAADIQAVAAQQLALDQRHFGAQSGRSGRRHESGSPRTDDDEIVALGRFGIRPVGRMHALDQNAIVFIERLDLREFGDWRCFVHSVSGDLNDGVVSQNYATNPSRDRKGVVASETGRYTRQPLPYGRGSDKLAAARV